MSIWLYLNVCCFFVKVFLLRINEVYYVVFIFGFWRFGFFGGGFGSYWVFFGGGGGYLGGSRIVFRLGVGCRYFWG